MWGQPDKYSQQGFFIQENVTVEWELVIFKSNTHCWVLKKDKNNHEVWWSGIWIKQMYHTVASDFKRELWDVWTMALFSHIFVGVNDW